MVWVPSGRKNKDTQKQAQVQVGLISGTGPGRSVLRAHISGSRVKPSSRAHVHLLETTRAGLIMSRKALPATVETALLFSDATVRLMDATRTTLRERFTLSARRPLRGSAGCVACELVPSAALRDDAAVLAGVVASVDIECPSRSRPPKNQV